MRKKYMQDMLQRRMGFDELGKAYPKDSSVKVEPITINGISCFWFTPEQAITNKVIVYLHGGAFAVGSIRSHESMVSHFASRFQTKILFIDYSLAPEHPYPGGMNDVLAVYSTLQKQYPDYTFTLMGDSAGGGLAISSIAAMFDHNLSLPQVVVLLSPWISLTCTNPSHQQNADKDIINTEYLKAAAKDYIGDNPMEKASPEFLTFNAFPPVLILAGEEEILLDDSNNFYAYIRKIQKESYLHIYTNQTHVWTLASIQSEASQQALKVIAEFLENNS
ncbi:alpha/beta hydrolase [Xanthocytophaga flava]|nr:alpha/beta hydrolase [Xanthocytophaga flavus]